MKKAAPNGAAFIGWRQCRSAAPMAQERTVGEAKLSLVPRMLRSMERSGMVRC